MAKPPHSGAAARSPLPLYLPFREYPRPAARAWIARAAEHWSLEKPFNCGEPWLPLTSIEGFLVLGHKDVDAPMGEIPPQLCAFVRLKPRDYDRLSTTCMEALTSFQNDRPRLTTAWSDAQAAAPKETKTPSGRAAEEAAKRDVALRALQFLLTYKLVTRQTTATAVGEYLRANPAAAWIVDALATAERIFPLDDLHPERLLAGAIPEQVAAKFKSICYGRDEDGLHVLLPSGVAKSAFITEFRARSDAHVEVNIAFADPARTETFVEHSVVTESVTGEIFSEDAPESTDFDCGQDPKFLTTKVETLTEARDVLRWALGQCIWMGGTDVDFYPLDLSSAVIRVRYNGQFRVRGSITAGMHARVISVVKIRARLNSTEKRLPQDGKFRVHAGDREAEIRVSTMPIEKGEQMESCALRVLGRVNIPTLEDLGLDDYQLRQFRWMAGRDNGIFFVTGPTGSGKTTTLNCILRSIAGEHINVMTIEDPVEMQIQWVKHSQVYAKIGYTFESALEHILRHDPDVIEIGEVRSQETARISMTAAQTGHLVFATVHTNSALASTGRLFDLGIHPTTVAESMIGASAQRLVACLCTQCREKVAATAEQIGYVRRFVARLNKNLGDAPVCPDAGRLLAIADNWLVRPEIYRPSGCGNCHGLGFDRRRALMEVYLIGNEPEAIDLVAANKPRWELQRFFFRTGHIDLAGQALRSALLHETTFEEVSSLLPLL